jgi:glutathione synthase/RimK-type ligase-like ATP-grasp enzyme
MNVLILGDRTDPHAAHVGRAVAQAGASVYYCNTQHFPTRIQLSWSPSAHAGAIALPEGDRLDLHQIHSIFWRSFYGVQVPLLQDVQQASIAHKDALSALRSLMQACPARWVNSWQAYQFHQEKPLQLHRIAQLGVPIPPTLISNDPQAILQFYESYPDLIFKPVYGGAYTQRVTPDHLNLNRLELASKIAPVTLQQYIPGTNVRSYVIGDEVYTAEIRSEAVDFREDAAAALIPTVLPEALQQQCVAIARCLLLEWTAIDWRLTPDGQYVFLEANPSPMFLHFERQTGFPITRLLVKQLIC